MIRKRLLALERAATACTVHNLAQPAMCGVAVEARMPQQRDSEVAQRERDRKAVHPFAETRRVKAGNRGNKVRAARESQSHREAVDATDDRARHTKFMQPLVDIAQVEPRTPGNHMWPARIIR